MHHKYYFFRVMHTIDLVEVILLRSFNSEGKNIEFSAASGVIQYQIPTII